MRSTDIFKLIGLVLAQCWQLMLDAFGDLSGKSLSFDTKKFVTVESLNKQLNQHAAVPLAGPASIQAMSIKPIPSISSNCCNTVVSIDQQLNQALPNSLFVKLPMPSLATRCFLNITGSWQLESYVCRHVAPDLPLRTPITYATHCQGTRFYLIQEDLNADDSVTLFTNPDMIQGVSVELAKRCVDAFAKLHAHHYDLSAAEREAILPLDHHPFQGTNMRIVSRPLNGAGLAPCLKAVPGEIPGDVEKAYRLSLTHWESLAEFWFSGPLSLVHGDSHLGNFFISGDEMGMLDFQAARWGKGIRDVQYFLIYSMPADVLVANEQELVDYYVQQRALYGTAIDAQQTWTEYRSFTYHTLMTIVVSIGFGALNEEQNELMKVMLRRAVAAVQRTDYLGWLTGFISSKENTH